MAKKHKPPPHSLVRKPSVSFTPHPKVLEHIDTLLSTGLYGRSRSEVVKRLVCEGIVQRVGHPRFKLDGAVKP